jgi:hypothetical protein
MKKPSYSSIAIAIALSCLLGLPAASVQAQQSGQNRSSLNTLLKGNQTRITDKNQIRESILEILGSDELPNLDSSVNTFISLGFFALDQGCCWTKDAIVNAI